MKRLLPLLLLIPMVLSATGQGEKAAETTVGTKTPITFTMFNAEVNPNWDEFQSPVAQEIKKRTGVTLEIEFAVGDPKQKLAVMAASGDYPDLVYAKGDLNLLKDAGGILQLDELIDQYGPNLKKMYGQFYDRLRWSKEDPHIYYVGSYPVHDPIIVPNGLFWLQHAVVLELGFPRLETLKDFENAIKTYYAKHPTINGQPTIPMTLLADGWRFLISVTNPAWAATGGSDDGEWYVDQETFKAVRHHTRQIEREYFRWLNHMWNEGLLDRESFIQKYDQYKAKIASGRVLALADAAWEISEPVTALRQAGMEERMYGQYPVVISEDVVCRVNQSPGYSGGWGVALTVDCKDPARAIEFLDWMATEEAQILTHWGIEGVHWKYDENGKRVFLPEIDRMRRTDPAFSKKTGIGNYSYPFPQWGRIKDSTGNYIMPDSEPEDQIKNYTEVEKKVLAGYGARMWMDLFPGPDEFPPKPYGAAWMIRIDDPDLVAIDNRVRDDIGMRRIPEAIMAPPEKFDEIWDAYLKEMEEAGLPRLTEEFNRLLRERIELWNPGFTFPE
ncbi:ABC transporter substrate-binding protein [Spirochaeta thermophila]|uniref:Polysaccharide ABC transporter substrate-binding protein n=1 Tax=Winmispira thermophila (strain ATCC 49972 / DSM 6192 / RI 19.B1) TaxID=665571 RepID=E0RPR2_WINT6|nr:ABC transporter substrate-binding protein [Spirochaeta thermophila]ADN01376.1 polysaccharide ABC transporter substrate-binding protein [Spirochaeta thermophila DSM 6192]